MKVSEGPIIAIQEFAASKSTVWAAITEIDKMHQWYFDNIPAFEPVLGFKTEFSVNAGERVFIHRWEVIAVEPEEMIRYTWRYPNYAGDAHVTFCLEEDEGKTKLTFTCIVLEDFQADIPEFARESCQSGWNYFIGDSLKKFIEKN